MSFKELYHIDVNQKTEKVDNLTYLSWSFAWAEVKKVDPMATYEIIEFPMLTNDMQVIPGVTVPFLKTPEGYFVKVAVTINGLTLTETLPVMNNKNVPLGTIAPMWVRPQGGGKATQEYKQTPIPTTFDINKSHKRCLAKAIALHGLGLYIYAGEDVPEKDPEVEQKKAEEIEKQRQETLRMIEQFIDAYGKPVIDKVLEIELKMKKSLDQLEKKWVDLAFARINELVIEIENTKQETKEEANA